MYATRDRDDIAWQKLLGAIIHDALEQVFGPFSVCACCPYTKEFHRKVIAGWIVDLVSLERHTGQKCVSEIVNEAAIVFLKERTVVVWKIIKE